MTRWLSIMALLSCVQLKVASAATAQAPAQPPPQAPVGQESGAEAAAESGEADVVEEAREHFKKGVDYYAEGDVNAARVELERAYALQPAYRLLYNLGQVAYEQREYAAAERYYRDYLAQGGAEIDAERRSEVERELRRLQDRVADVRIATNVPGAKLFVDGRDVGRAPLSQPLRLSAGRRVLRAEAAGHTPVSREFDVVGGEQRTLDLRFGPALGAGEARSDEHGGGALHPALWTGIATGVLALGAGGMAYWASVDDNAYDRELEHRTTRTKLDDLSDSTKTKALLADILLGTAIASAAATVVLLVMVDPPDEHTETAASSPTLIVTPTGLRATF